MLVKNDKRIADKGCVCILKNKFTKEVEYLPLSEVNVTYENEQMSLKELFDKQIEMINELNERIIQTEKRLLDKISNMQQIIADYQESTTKLMATVSKAATTALQVAQNQSIQIETINQEVFK